VFYGKLYCLKRGRNHPIVIHTGLLVAGSIGGYQRLNYSVLGDAVNIAARLEQLNKNIQEGNPYQILISETTFQLVNQHFSTQKVQQLSLRGRQQLTMIYAITGKLINSEGTQKTHV
jgi:adenylate cyclase